MNISQNEIHPDAVSERPEFSIPFDEVTVVKLNHMGGEARFGIFEEFRVRAFVIDVGVGDAQRRLATFRKGQNVLGFVMMS